MSETHGWLDSLTDKNGRLLLPILRDMQGRDYAVLIVSFGGDDPEAPISAHMLLNHGNELAAGVKLLAETSGCTEIILYAGPFDLTGLIHTLLAMVNVPVNVKEGPSSPVLREPTALYSVLNTGVIRAGNAEEQYQKSFLSYGYQGRPTLAVDAETVYLAGKLADRPDSAVTKHIIVTGRETAILEAEVGTALDRLLAGTDGLKTLLLGGVWGSYISASDLTNTYLTYSCLHDSVRILGEGDCVVAQTAALYERIKELSCAKCVLCREGSWQIHAIFHDITEGKANRDDMTLIEDICPLISAGSLCDFGRCMVRPALTAVTVCRDELTEHITGKSCAAGQCEGLRSYLIEPTLCTGCGDCPDSCPEEAIEGQDGFIHMIDDKLCVKCGECLPVCPEGAIKCGGRFKVPKKLTKVGKFH